MDKSDLELSEDLHTITAEIKKLENNMTKSLIENGWQIGQRLSQVKSKISHGGFGKWLKNNFAFSQQYANQFMKFYKENPNYNSSSNFNKLPSWKHVVEIMYLPKELNKEKFIEEKAFNKDGTAKSTKEIAEIKKENKNKHSKQPTPPEHKQKEEIKKEYYTTQGTENNNDTFADELYKLSENLHGKLRDKEYRDRCLHIAQWLSKFDKETQLRIESIDLTNEFKTIFNEFEGTLGRLIKNTIINGKQINRLVKMYREYISINLLKLKFHEDGGFRDEILNCTTSSEIDKVLNEFEQYLNDEKKSKEESQQNQDFNNFDWDNLLKSTQAQTNYRKELGLLDSATDDEVRKEFRSLMGILHPDKKGNEAVFKKYQKMYEEFKTSQKITA